MRVAGESVRAPRGVSKDGSHKTGERNEDFHYVQCSPVAKEFMAAEHRLLSKGYFKITDPEDHGFFLPPDGTVLMACLKSDLTAREKAALDAHNARDPMGGAFDGVEVTGSKRESGAMTLEQLQASQRAPEGDYIPSDPDVEALFGN